MICIFNDRRYVPTIPSSLVWHPRDDTSGVFLEGGSSEDCPKPSSQPVQTELNSFTCPSSLGWAPPPAAWPLPLQCGPSHCGVTPAKALSQLLTYDFNPFCPGVEICWWEDAEPAAGAGIISAPPASTLHARRRHSVTRTLPQAACISSLPLCHAPRRWRGAGGGPLGRVVLCPPLSPLLFQIQFPRALLIDSQEHHLEEREKNPS